MKKIIVHRLENSKGLGPFRGGHRMEAEQLKEHLGIRQCLVDHKGMKSRIFKKLSNAGWRCAWTSEKDFNIWMNDKKEFFEQLGYFKVTYEISQYKLSAKQELYSYNEELEDYVLFNIDGFQVFFNPENAVKIN